MPANISKLVMRGGACTILVLLLAHIATMSRQSAAWEDEVFVTSTSWSIVQSQPATLSVLSQYPRTPSPLKFYGPVSFEAGAMAIRLFGLSMLAWRLLCYGGVILTVLATISLTRFLGGDGWGQLIAAFIVAAACSIATLLPGRWDFVTMGMFLTALNLFLRSAAQAGGSRFRSAVASGVLLGLTLGSTPRSLPLVASEILAILVTCALYRNIRKTCLLSSAIMLATAFAVQSALLLPLGLMPFTWFQYVRKGTKGDFINASPLVGGTTWGLGVMNHKANIIIFLLLGGILISCLLARLRLRKEVGGQPWRVLVFLIASVNFLFMALTLNRVFGLMVFWLPLVVVAVMCWFDWEFLRKSRLAIPAALMSALCVLVLSVQEAEHMIAIALTWNRRDSRPIRAFIARAIPKASAVYGPVGGYFYPVEQSGSKYLYLIEQTNPGVVSERNARLDEKLDEEICSRPTYAVWNQADSIVDREDAMPPALKDRIAAKTASFEEPPIGSTAMRLLRSLGALGDKYGYRNIAVYRLQSPTNCETAAPSHATSP